MTRFPPPAATCPHPDGCPVPRVGPLQFTTHTIRAGTRLFRCYDAAWGYDEPNPGDGDTRFAPFEDLGTGEPVPTLYLGATDVAVLLETVFHEVHHDSDRVIYESQLNGRLLAEVQVPRDLVVVDLRDTELARLGLEREELVATPAEHYPCTRRWAQALHAQLAHGLVWHSRQAEILGRSPEEVAVVFCDHYRVGRKGWELARAGIHSLYDGPGRARVDALAEELGAVVEES